MRKSLSALLALLIGVSLTACGKKAAVETPKEVTNSNFNALGTFPIVKEKQTIKVLIPWSGKDITQLWNTTEYEKKTNVHVEWQVVPAESFKEKRAVLLASGDLPDAIANGPSAYNFSPSEQMQYGSQGIFIDLTKYIDKDSVYFKKVITDNPQIKKLITSIDGKVYALPDINVAFHSDYSQKLWLNTTWLDKLGLKVPTTTDELEKVLIAFKTQDPNGNGKADEKPLLFTTNAWNGAIDGYLMNAFTYSDGITRLQLNNGKIEFAPTKAEYQDGLRYIRKLYSQGLIAPESFTIDNATAKKLNESGDRTLVGGSSGGTTSPLAAGIATSERFAQYDIIPPIAGPKGFKTAANFQNFNDVTPGVFEITKGAKDPALVMRWVDWMYTTEANLFHGNGQENVDWKKADGNLVGLDGKPAKYVVIPQPKPNPREGLVNWDQTMPSFRTKEYREGFASPKDWKTDLKDPMSQERHLYDGTKAYEAVAPKANQTIPPITVPADQISDFVRIQNDINTYTKESIAKFITGGMDVDKDWTKFQDQLKKLGLEDYLKMNQTTYDKIYK